MAGDRDHPGEELIPPLAMRRRGPEAAPGDFRAYLEFVDQFLALFPPAGARRPKAAYGRVRL